MVRTLTNGVWPGGIDQPCSFSAAAPLVREYVEPEIDWEDQWDTETSTTMWGRGGAGRPDLEFWWHLFDDP